MYDPYVEKCFEEKLDRVEELVNEMVLNAIVHALEKTIERYELFEKQKQMTKNCSQGGGESFPPIPF